MIGWESLDHTVRLFCYQCINASEVVMAHRKGADYSTIPVEFRLETPSSGIPWQIYTAGASR